MVGSDGGRFRWREENEGGRQKKIVALSVGRWKSWWRKGVWGVESG